MVPCKLQKVMRTRVAIKFMVNAKDSVAIERFKLEYVKEAEELKRQTELARAAT